VNMPNPCRQIEAHLEALRRQINTVAPNDPNIPGEGHPPKPHPDSEARREYEKLKGEIAATEAALDNCIDQYLHEQPIEAVGHTDIKLDEGEDQSCVVVEARILKGNGTTDFMLDGGADRRKRVPSGPEANSLHRRALVHDINDTLTINYDRDYAGGVVICGNVRVDGLDGDLASLVNDLRKEVDRLKNLLTEHGIHE
jgi:hypothetical protein